MEQYVIAQSYAFKASPTNYKDLVHDAYLLWYDKTGTNLFERSNSTVISVIRNVLYEYRNRNYFLYDGERYTRSITSKDSFEDDFQLFEDSNNPEIQLEYKELEEALIKALPELSRKVLEGLKQGYKKGEIMEQLETSNVTITLAVKKIYNELDRQLKSDHRKQLKYDYRSKHRNKNQALRKKAFRSTSVGIDG